MGLRLSLQHEWNILQRVIEVDKTTFKLIDEYLETNFLPRLFGQVPSSQVLLGLSVKQGGIGIQIPSHTSRKNHDTSRQAAGYLKDAILQSLPFSIETHSQLLQKSKMDAKESKEKTGEIVLHTVKETASPPLFHALLCVQETGAWLSTAPHTVNGTKLSMLEFRDHLSLRYNLTPTQLPALCDTFKCGARLDLCHLLDCKKGGLVHQSHQKV